MTLAEVARHFGVSRERIRQLEAAALLKLRARFAALGIDARSWCEPYGDPPEDEDCHDAAGPVRRACTQYLATHAPRLERRPSWPYRQRRRAA